MHSVLSIYELETGVGKLICWLAKVGSNRMAPAVQTLLSQGENPVDWAAAAINFGRDETDRIANKIGTGGRIGTIE